MWPRALLVVLALLLTNAALLLAPIDYRLLGHHGYAAIFVVTLVATGAVVAPIPYVALIVAGGSFLDPTLVALVAGFAATLGEVTGYVLGRTGRSLVPTGRRSPYIERVMHRYGLLVVFLGAVVPNPFFDAIGMAAGAFRTPIGRFLVVCFAGKTIRFWLLATLGGAMLLPA